MHSDDPIWARVHLHVVTLVHLAANAIEGRPAGVAVF